MALLNESTFSGSNGSHFKLRLEYSYEQNTNLNQTTITYTLKFVSQDGWSGSGTANSITGYINSAKVGTTDSIGVNATKTLGTKQVTITHNNDGTFPSTSYSARIDSAWNNVNRAEVSGSLTSSNIPTINRQSTWRDFSIQNLENEFSLLINKYVSSYYNVVQVRNSDNSIQVMTIEDVIDGTLVTFNSTELNQIYTMDNNSNEYPLKIYMDLITYADSTKTTQIGTTQTKIVNGYLVNANPTYTIAYRDTNTTTKTITNNDQQIIQNKSSLQFDITNATALKGATLSTISIEVNGVTNSKSISTPYKSLAFGQINVAHNINANAILTDSRGLTTTKVVPITILSYSNPTGLITLNRKSNYYTETDITVDANYSSLDNKNTLTIQYRIKKKNDLTWESWNNLSDNVTTTFYADNEYEWDVQVRVRDSIAYTTYSLSLGIGIPIFFIDRILRNASVNCFPKSTNAFEVNGKTEINGDLVVESVNILKTYSTTEETIIGYYDGKLLYRRVITGTKESGTDLQISATWVDTIDTLVRFDGTLKSLSNYNYPLVRYESSSIYVTMNMNRVDKYIKIVSSAGNYSNGDVTIIVEYTKV